MKKGEKVTWESQAGGSWTEKTGKVVEEVPAGADAREYVPDGAKKSHVKFDSISSRDRILVAVPAGKDGKIMHYYCPSKGVLTSQGNE